MKHSANELIALEERVDQLYGMLPANEIAEANSAIDRFVHMDFSKMIGHFKSRLAKATDLKDMKSLKSDIEEYIKDGQEIVKEKFSNGYVALRRIVNAVVAAGLFLIPFAGIATMTAFLVKRSKDFAKIKENISKSLPSAQNLLQEVKQKIERIKK
jgi:hypothetical protein